jgi:hypothetical protein
MKDLWSRAALLQNVTIALFLVFRTTPTGAHYLP